MNGQSITGQMGKTTIWAPIFRLNNDAGEDPGINSYFNNSAAQNSIAKVISFQLTNTTQKDEYKAVYGHIENAFTFYSQGHLQISFAGRYL